MILGYKKYFPAGGLTNFAYKIIHGIKKHSIRIDTNNRWKPGMKIQHAHGVRTKNYMQFFESECKSTQDIEIKEVLMCDSTNAFFYTKNGITKAFRVKVDGHLLRWEVLFVLYKNDGFDSGAAFLDWFWDGFEGKIIHWTDLKY